MTTWPRLAGSQYRIEPHALRYSLIDENIIRLNVPVRNIAAMQAISHNADELIEDVPSERSRDRRSYL